MRAGIFSPETVLINNYPNPFTYSTTIDYVLPESARIKLAVFNAQGEKVEVLVDGQRSAGQHSVVWNAEGYPAGLYFYTIGSQQYSITRKCMLLK